MLKIYVDIHGKLSETFSDSDKGHGNLVPRVYGFSFLFSVLCGVEFRLRFQITFFSYQR